MISELPSPVTLIMPTLNVIQESNGIQAFDCAMHGALDDTRKSVFDSDHATVILGSTVQCRLMHIHVELLQVNHQLINTTPFTIYRYW
jgi:hypothetical protein